MHRSIKALALVGLGLFLYSRFFSGNLLYYINVRFVWLTLLAAVGLIAVGASYRYVSGHTHTHDHTGHDHGQLTWFGLLLVMLPVILGLLVPPQPLGAAAMGSRDISTEALTSTTAPGRNEILAKPKGDKNVYDWLVEFSMVNDPAAFTGKEARLIGFIYRDDRFKGDEFMVSRFVISCCAADAAPLGLLVKWPESGALAQDQWVEVKGQFDLGRFDGEELPVLMAESISPIETPAQPYLYPY